MSCKKAFDFVRGRPKYGIKQQTRCLQIVTAIYEFLTHGLPNLLPLAGREGEEVVWAGDAVNFIGLFRDVGVRRTNGTRDGIRRLIPHGYRLRGIADR